ncbi:MAG: hypothetical protein KDI90_09500 [Alphaproteobacteria bacterium]|nr:hypothetical protein [Alphaproteobacteria bacterium]MCB9975046.1 hypothetical protein [Rhodospirillales bacterium]
MTLKGPKGRRKLLVLAACAGLALSAVWGMSTGGTEQSLQGTHISLSSFEPGSSLTYELFQDGQIVEKGRKDMDDKGRLTLDATRYLDENPESKLTYNLKIENLQKQAKGEASDPLNLLLKIDNASGHVGYAGAGLDQFSDILLSDGQQTTKSKADWTGGFAGEKLFDRLDDKNRNLLKLAFRGHDLENDILPREDGVVEVFFGDPSGSSLGAVQSRWTRALAMMTEQLSAVMMQQAMIVGAFFDAKFQLESQRKMQELMARAHKDYHPSEQICRFGTFVKSLAHTERAFELDMRALNRALLNQMLGTDPDSSAEGPSSEFPTRIAQFTTKYCDPHDNNNSLDLMCPTTVALGAGNPLKDRFNKDIDFYRTVDSKLTLDANFADNTITNDEEDVFALANNLYFPDVFETIEYEDVGESDLSHYNSRSYAATIAAAQNSYVNIIGMKTSAPPGLATPAVGAWPPNIVPPPVVNYAEDTGWTFMKAFLRELGGLTDPEIHAYLGERPSYFAQMEVLSKKVFQSPHFFTNLYDKPVNVDRIGAAIDAIALMNMRDRFDSSLRREMLTSLLVEQSLKPHVENLSVQIFKAIQDEQPTLE